MKGRIGKTARAAATEDCESSWGNRCALGVQDPKTRERLNKNGGDVEAQTGDESETASDSRRDQNVARRPMTRLK
eukprot:6127208-Pleurochrysis_carterae.AAC.1